MTPRGLRNRNPGNIEHNSITAKYLGCTGSDGRFCTFDKMENGLRALAVLLLTYQRLHGINTIRAAISRWCPPKGPGGESQAATDAYIVAVTTAAAAVLPAVNADTPLDFSDPTVLRTLVQAIGRHENGAEPFDHYCTAAMIDEGVGMALGIRPQDVVVVAEAPQVEQAPEQKEEKPVLPVLTVIGGLMPLVQSLIQVFQPLAQAKLSTELNKTVKDPVLSNSMAEQIIGIVKKATGIADPVQAVAAVRADADAVKLKALSVAAPGVVQSDAGKLVATVEDQTLSWIEQVSPMLDKIHGYEKDEWAAEEDSRDRASVRDNKLDHDDMARPLIYFALGILGFLTLFVCFIAGYQIVTTGKVATEVWASLTGLIGTISGIVLTVVVYRFGSTRQSVAKDATIAEIATSRR